MENENHTKVEAYDIARKEFYDLRMEQDIERRVAEEEARAVGATFGKSYIEIGIELEGKALDQWKEKAHQLLTLKRGRAAAFSGSSAAEDEDETVAASAAAADATSEDAAPVLPAVG